MTTKSFQEITEISWTNEGMAPTEADVGVGKGYPYPWYHWLIKNFARLINNSAWAKEKFDENDTAITSINSALDGKVPTSRTINGTALTSDISLTASDVSAIATTQKGVASGVASLDSSTKLTYSQLPSGLMLYIGKSVGGSCRASNPLSLTIPNSKAFSKILVTMTATSGYNITSYLSVNGSDAQRIEVADMDRYFALEYGANAGVDIVLDFTNPSSYSIYYFSIMVMGVI